MKKETICGNSRGPREGNEQGHLSEKLEHGTSTKRKILIPVSHWAAKERERDAEGR